MSEEGINAAEDIKKLKKELNELSLFVYGKTLTPHGWKVEKHEKIEKMALQIYYHNSYDCSLSFEECWKEAEKIYKFVKQKQEEANDDIR